MSWYLKGFCLQRQSYRTFKLSRIEHLTMNEETYHARDYALEQERGTGYQPELVAIKAIISPSIKDQFIERFGRNSVEVYHSNSYLANIDVPQNSIGFQFLASF